LKQNPVWEKMTLFEKIKNLNLLLIDDDEWIRDSMRLFFEAEGCQLIALETAEQAIELLKTQLFDIIIADFRLPGVNGIEFFKKTRELHPCPLKILITAYMNNAVAKAAKKAGVHDLIEKPFNPDTIEKSLSRLLARSSSRQSKDFK
jgi:DNA-binding NtrC family response regulator